MEFCLLTTVRAAGHPAAQAKPEGQSSDSGQDRARGQGLAGNLARTHTRPETQRQQIEQALRRWPASLLYALERVGAVLTAEGHNRY